jgi:hypothetical protein
VAHAKATLLRLRRYAREESASALRRAEQDAAAQAARVEAIRAGLRRARETVDPTDADALGNYLAWRLRQELAERREVLRLQQRTRDVETARARHAVQTREELSMAALVDAEAAIAAESSEHAELAENDAVAGGRHARAQAAS